MINRDERAPTRSCHDQAAIRGARETRAPRSISGASRNSTGRDSHPERGRRGLDGGELADPLGYGRIPKDRRSRHARCDLLEQFQPFRAHAVFA